jgi:PAP2 superfamily
VMTYAVFDIGASVYWLLPTAPPWYAASAAARRAAGQSSEALRSQAMAEPVLRRMMVEYGEFFWGDGWGPLYSVFGGNPLAAMPSLHFATSLMAALLLAEVGPVAGTLGFTYAATLGFALLAGAALTGAVRWLGPRAEPALRSAGGAIAALEGIAHQKS